MFSRIILAIILTYSFCIYAILDVRATNQQISESPKGNIEITILTTELTYNPEEVIVSFKIKNNSSKKYNLINISSETSSNIQYNLSNNTDNSEKIFKIFDNNTNIIWTNDLTDSDKVIFIKLRNLKSSPAISKIIDLSLFFKDQPPILIQTKLK